MNLDELCASVGARASEADVESRLSKATMEEISKSGILETAIPGRAELTLADLQGIFEASIALGKVCSSSGWIAALHWVHRAVIGQHLPAFSEAAGAAKCPARVAAVFAPQGQLSSREGGFELSGRWTFASGCDHADAFLLAGVVDPATSVWPDIEARFALVPRDEVEIVETWDALGMRGTGSHDVVVESAAVSRSFTASLHDAFSGCPQTGALPLMPLLTAVAAAPVIGIAKGMFESFKERASERVTLAGQFQRDRESLQLRLAEAAIELRSCHLMLDDVLHSLVEKGTSGHPMDPSSRASLCAQASYVVVRAKRIADGLIEACGATSLSSRSTLARQYRDLTVIRNHAVFDFDRLGVDHGGTLLGIDPRSALV